MIHVQQYNPPIKSPDDHKINWLWVLAYFIFYVLTVGVEYVTHQSVANIFWFPVVFLTAALVYAVYTYFIHVGRLKPHIVQFADIFRGFSHSFFSGGIFAFFTELWLSTVVLIVIMFLFGSSRALTSIMNGDYVKDPQSYVCNNPFVHLYLAFTSFCVAGLIEECIKAYLLQYVAKLYLPHTKHLTRTDIKTFVWIGLCIGLGFGTVEGVIYVCYGGSGSGFISQLVLWLIRAFVAIPFHSITGFMWGTQLARREANKQIEKTWIKMGYQQVLLHGLYDFIELEIALDLLCASTPTVTQVVISIAVAIGYTLFSGGLAFVQYRNLVRIGNAEFVPDVDNDYQQT